MSKSSKIREHLRKEADVQITSMMDIMTVLIFFLLNSYIVAVTFIDVPIPKVPTSEIELKNAQKLTEHFALTIEIFEDHLRVSGSGIPDLPKIFDKKDQHYDLEALQATLKNIKGLFQKEKEITIIPKDNTEYNDIIEIIDVSRNEWVFSQGKSSPMNPFKELFPVVIMGGVE